MAWYTKETGDIAAQTNGPEIAMALRILESGSCASKGSLDHYFALRTAYGRDVWRQVITALVQRRG